jgi:2-polyprenyl-6-methoxyphenol hydroxylase-like FAD-dependent oxidoreductase
MGGGTTDRAVVLGGSMAGLLAARVLADHDLDVRVLDRDDLRTTRGQRRGVPQARHIHALLPRGRQILEELFPGLTAELIDAGAPVGDLLGDARLHLNGHRLRRAASGLTTLSLSRPLLEERVRSRVRRLANVSFAEPCDVVGFATSADRRRVTGVRLLRRADGSAEEVLDADVVIDAMGRGSRTPAWLASLGHQAPVEEHLTIDLGSTTRTYRMRPDALGGDWGSLQGPTPTSPRGGALARIEGGRWMVTLFGFLGDHPPTDPDGFLGFARSLAFPDIYDAIHVAEPLDEPVALRFPASVRRRYDRLTDLPEGLLPLGDSVCSLDPVYGQGMTVAGLQALSLRDHLRHGRLQDPRRFLHDSARVVDAPWTMVLGGDLALPGARGPRTRRVRLASTYVARLHAAAAHDERLATAFVRVMGLVDPPAALLRPSVVGRVVRGAWRSSGRVDRRPRAAPLGRPGGGRPSLKEDIP